MHLDGPMWSNTACMVIYAMLQESISVVKQVAVLEIPCRVQAWFPRESDFRYPVQDGIRYILCLAQ